MYETIIDQLKSGFHHNPRIREMIPDFERKVQDGKSVHLLRHAGCWIFIISLKKKEINYFKTTLYETKFCLFSCFCCSVGLLSGRVRQNTVSPGILQVRIPVNLSGEWPRQARPSL
jgi:hypothetical protein